MRLNKRERAVLAKLMENLQAAICLNLEGQPVWERLRDCVQRPLHDLERGRHGVPLPSDLDDPRRKEEKKAEKETWEWGVTELKLVPAPGYPGR